MLLKYYKLDHIDVMVFDAQADLSVIGFYVCNGVLSENVGSLGISYTLDTLIYNALCDILPPTMKVTSSTNYDFSEFIIQCCKKETHIAIKKIEELFSEFIVDADYLEDIKATIIDRCENYKYTLDDQFDQDYYEHPRMRINIMGESKNIKGLNCASVQEWYNKYFCFNRMFFSICNPPESFSSICVPKGKNSIVSSPFLKPRRFQHRTQRDIRFFCEQWEYADVILSFDCPDYIYKKLLEAELLCFMIELKTAILKIKFDVSMDKPKISIDHNLPRIIFSMTVSSIELKAFLHQLFALLFSPLAGVYQKAKEEMVKNYFDFENDIYEFNKFCGWNYCEGNKYDICDFLNSSFISQIQETDENEVEKLRADILKKSNLTLSAICPEPISL